MKEKLKVFSENRKKCFFLALVATMLFIVASLSPQFVSTITALASFLVAAGCWVFVGLHVAEDLESDEGKIDYHSFFADSHDKTEPKLEVVNSSDE